MQLIIFLLIIKNALEIKVGFDWRDLYFATVNFFLNLDNQNFSVLRKLNFWYYSLYYNT